MAPTLRCQATRSAVVATGAPSLATTHKIAELLRPCEYSEYPCEYSEYPCEYSEYPYEYSEHAQDRRAPAINRDGRTKRERTHSMAAALYTNEENKQTARGCID